MCLIRSSLTLAILTSLLVTPPCPAQSSSYDSVRQNALKAAKQATTFLADQVSTNGGYLWSYSADLSKREGEGVVETQTAWVQPPGTPAVGEAFVHLWNATQDKQFLDAAFAAADVLRRGQMRSGGWHAAVEFEPARRLQRQYRIDKPTRKGKDHSSLDDDQTQSALRFLIQLDQAVGFQNESIHEMVLYGLDAIVKKAQFASGGFPQVWMANRTEPADAAPRKANYPEDWNRIYQGHNEYWSRFTLNDHLASDMMDLLILAEQAYKEKRFAESATKLADALLSAQMPSPQPGWAQQYNKHMQPIWARKFEPPAISGSESQSVIRTLMQFYAWTGNRKYLKPIPNALDYLESSLLPDGQLARFYELKTNRPLYFDRQYKLTYDDADMPTHYGFKVKSNLAGLRAGYEKLSKASDSDRAHFFENKKIPTEPEIQSIVSALDARGAWLSDKPMRFHKHTGPTIDMGETVIKLNTLADFLRP